MSPQRYNYYVANQAMEKPSKINREKEISGGFPDKLVTLISTCIGTQVTETDALVVADISITQGGIDIRKLSAIDSACQLQSIMKKIHNFKNMCKKKKK